MSSLGLLVGVQWSLEPYRRVLQPLENLASRELQRTASMGVKTLCEFFHRVRENALNLNAGLSSTS
ncbi:hypothetical protein EON65_39470 [archaeon]|nr:MAG: hypothetical protein EON65_39470 [archaeon]